VRFHVGAGDGYDAVHGRGDGDILVAEEPVGVWIDDQQGNCTAACTPHPVHHVTVGRLVHVVAVYLSK